MSLQFEFLPVILGSAMSSPVTLPFINLKNKTKKNTKGSLYIKAGVAQESDFAAVFVVLGQKNKIGNKMYH